MDESTKVSRRKHGANSMAIACRHIVRAIETMSDAPVGFHSAPSDRKQFPDAWCRLLCPCCYEFARAAAAPGALVETFRLR